MPLCLKCLILEDEHLRIILLFTLESTGHIFFEKTADFVERLGQSKNLQYFSNTHLEVEKAHAIFEQEMEKQLLGTELTLEKFSAGLALIDRVYEAFIQMFDGLVHQHNIKAIEAESFVKMVAQG